MKDDSFFEAGKAHILSQLIRVHELEKTPKKKAPQPFVTISREAGAGGLTVAGKLVEFLNSFDKDSPAKWTMFDKNLIQKVFEDEHLSFELEKYIPETKFSKIQSVFEELFGLHPSKSEFIVKTGKTILGLAQIGNCVLLGRGANIITHNMLGGFHVRLIGSPERKLKYIQELFGLKRDEALKYIRETDIGRREYARKGFGKDISDPLLYDMVINTDHMTFCEAVELIGDQVLRLRKRLEQQ